MTRINVVPVEELSDQWLLAEYRELPRVIKGNYDIVNAPEKYCLGKGHVKWAKKYSFWLLYRYDRLLKELKYRGFRPKHSLYELVKTYGGDSSPVLDYYVSDMDIEINRERLIEKYRMKPDFYRWTGRERPEWLKGKTMSEHITPEVGDVFQSNEDKDVRLHITGKNKAGLEAIVSNRKEVWDIDSWYFDKDYYTYLGKSKASVDDLFKTENE